MSALLIGTAAVRRQPVALSLPGLLHHTLIVGQSGSGKSFFVGRLLEEILLRTGARVVALDPNGDLRNLDRVEMSALAAQRAEICAAAASAGLQSFDGEESFRDAWDKQRMVFLTAEREPPVLTPQRIERRRLRVDWAKIGEIQDSLLELDSHDRPAQFLGVRACRGLVKWANDEKRPLKVADSLRGLADAAELFGEQNVNMRVYEYAKNLRKADWDNVKARFLDLAARHLAWLPDEEKEKEKGYRGLTLTDILDGPFADEVSGLDWNCLIIGLDAAPRADALLAASVTLNQLWTNAKLQTRLVGVNDDRVPTFIVIDEAHNFVPATASDPLRRRVSEQVLQIASEGRKFGLYLILATQRPTKLHPELVPECENSCVLRVQSDRELHFAAETLGIQHARVEPASRFTTGQGLLSGRWVDGELVEVLAAPARTAVGGGGLKDVWTFGTREIAWDAADRKSARDLDSSSIATGHNLAPRGPADSDKEAVVLIGDFVRASLTPVALASLAHLIRSELGLGTSPDEGWDGHSTFKEYLLSLGVPGLEIDPTGPSYAYFGDVHDAPDTTISNSQGILFTLHNMIDIPLLTPEQFAAVFNAASDELAVNPFGLSQTGKAIRDALQGTPNPVNRSSINYILKGIGIGGHDFSPDRSQDPEVLAEAFIRGVLKTSGLSPQDAGSVTALRTHIVGAMPSRTSSGSSSIRAHEHENVGAMEVSMSERLDAILELKRERKYREAANAAKEALSRADWQYDSQDVIGNTTLQAAYIFRRQRNRRAEAEVLQSFLARSSDEAWKEQIQQRLSSLEPDEILSNEQELPEVRESA